MAQVLIISTGMGSIGDNNSGGLYAYRTAKAIGSGGGARMAAVDGTACGVNRPASTW